MISRSDALRGAAVALLVLSGVIGGPAVRAHQAAPGIIGPEARSVLDTLRQTLERVTLARERDERFDIRQLYTDPLNVRPLVGLSRQALLDVLGAPSVDCRRTLGKGPTPVPARIAPCRAADDLAYSFYALPKTWLGGGTVLLLEFDGGERCTRAQWVGTQ